jgi:hypothetical protein
VGFTPLPLYLQGKSPCYTVDMRLDGTQGRYGRGGEEKNYPYLFWESNRGRPVRSVITVLTELSWLLVLDSPTLYSVCTACHVVSGNTYSAKWRRRDVTHV